MSRIYVNGRFLTRPITGVERYAYMICKTLVEMGTDFTIIGIQEKINKNNLSSVVTTDIKLGLSQAKLIRDYLSNMNEIDVFFTHNLVEAFKRVYGRLSISYIGDELYYEILDEVCPDHKNLSIRSAANAVVAYLFHECEIFEK